MTEPTGRLERPDRRFTNRGRPRTSPVIVACFTLSREVSVSPFRSPWLHEWLHKVSRDTTARPVGRSARWPIR